MQAIESRPLRSVKRRLNGVQGLGNVKTWHALRDAAVRYGDADTDEGADGAFLAHRRELARAAIRWVLLLPPGIPVQLVGDLRGVEWQAFARAALVVTAAVREEPPGVTSERLRVAFHRLRQAAIWWVEDAARFDLGIRGALRAAEVAA